jgi:hypothetical protein
MSEATTESYRDATLGALVADAASLGLHWIYTQPRIRRAAGESPEFQEPKAENYDGVPGYFAHPLKEAGDNTMYGENVLLLLRSISGEGEYRMGSYLTQFRDYFGPGGQYVGYADGPMRGTLFNADAMTREIATIIREMDLSVSEERHNQFASYISRYFLEGSADHVKQVLRSPFDLYKTTEEEYAVLDHVVDTLQQYKRPIGPDDAQMPALTKVTPILARYGDSSDGYEALESAVRMTNNSDLAVAYARGLYRLLAAISSPEGRAKLGAPDSERPADQDTLVAMMQESFSDLPEENRNDIQKALGMLGQDTKAVTLKFGPACDCAMGVPSALHNVATAESFAAGVRTNILSCGDSCGRAMVVGPLLAALYGTGDPKGVPAEWIKKTRSTGEASSLLGTISA